MDWTPPSLSPDFSKDILRHDCDPVRSYELTSKYVASNAWPCVDNIATASNSEIASTSATTTRSLLSFDDINPKESLKSDLSSTEEERGPAAAATGGAATGNTVVVSNKEQSSKQVTVTKYSNNGLVQRFKRWFKRTFGGDKTGNQNRRLRQSSDLVLQ
ncbi:unnamed protein product [Phytophthora fragariaefolia]|uniref:Unnamed protein product n=1 Tax=Phytophthora fragariaefolia TaxID=1490495 RepID=A0A9W6Y4X5_9STRA|nr:unnamed protein product [Phytophthora fragariaefolia]